MIWKVICTVTITNNLLLPHNLKQDPTPGQHNKASVYSRRVMIASHFSLFGFFFQLLNIWEVEQVGRWIEVLRNTIFQTRYTYRNYYFTMTHYLHWVGIRLLLSTIRRERGRCPANFLSTIDRIWEKGNPLSSVV